MYSGMEVGTHHHRFHYRLPRTRTDHDAIWVIVDRLTKSTVTPQIRDVTDRRQTYTYTSEALTYKTFGMTLPL